MSLLDLMQPTSTQTSNSDGMVGEPTQGLVSLVVLVAVFLAVERVLRLLWLGRRRRKRRSRTLAYRMRGAFWASRRIARASGQKITGALPGVTVARLRAIDGDTLEDPASGQRYRLANIDCPETDDRAGCYRERVKGEQAKGAAEALLASAASIEVRPAGQTDPYGRSIAHVRINGEDFGELMIRSGFARRWEGKRERWCGADGGLALLAAATGAEHACKRCGAGQPRRANASNVVYPAVYRSAPDKVTGTGGGSE